MSELSPVYSEYERISSLFRRLNEGVLLSQQMKLGIKLPSTIEPRQIQQDLESALNELVEERVTSSTITLADILEQLRSEDREVPAEALAGIRGRVHRGVEHLTREDIETIEMVTDVLDSKSELLFRRIQK